MADGSGHETGTFRAADGCALFAQTWRPAADPRGVVLQIHGLGEHSDRYLHLREALLDAGYLLAACDLRGHGRSGGRRGHIDSFEVFRTDLALALEHFRTLAPGKPLFLYGHSLGSVIALDYILQGGDGLRGAVLSGAALDASRVAPAWQVAVLKALSRVWPTFSLKVALPGALLSRYPEVCSAYDSDPMVHWTRSARLATEGLAAVERVRSNAGALHIPVLFIHGEQDPIVPVDAARAFFDAVPASDKTMHVYPNGLHECHNDQGYDRAMADVVAWLNERS
ncbi:MAG: alpha/beta hydrolase [Anaerolineae bacterium]